MKTSATIILAASAMASAGVTFNSTTGEFICSRPNSQWCAGDSFGTDIIIRCNNQGKGQPGRCGDNLAGQFPVGVNPSLCWQSDQDAGDAACEKNCVVYASTPFRLPPSVCSPYASVTGSQTIPTRRPSGTGNLGGRNTTITVTGSSTAIPNPPRPTGTGGAGPRPNGTAPTNAQGGSPGSPTNNPGQPGSSASGTRTPIPPSGTPTGPSTLPTAGAAHNSVAYIAVVGIVAAYFL